MAAIQTLSYLETAKRRFPRSVNRIRGSGRYALVSRCTMPWTILLYETAQERAAALDRWSASKCMSINCGYEHYNVDL